MDPFSSSLRVPWHKRTRRPLGNVEHGAELQDGWRRSHGETDLLVRKRHGGIQWPLWRSDKSHRQRGGLLLDSGQIQKKWKVPLFILLDEFFFFLLIIIFNLTSCPVGPTLPSWGIMGYTFKDKNNGERGHNCDDRWQCYWAKHHRKWRAVACVLILVCTSYCTKWKCAPLNYNK